MLYGTGARPPPRFGTLTPSRTPVPKIRAPPRRAWRRMLGTAGRRILPGAVDRGVDCNGGAAAPDIEPGGLAEAGDGVSRLVEALCAQVLRHPIKLPLPGHAPQYSKTFTSWQLYTFAVAKRGYNRDTIRGGASGWDVPRAFFRYLTVFGRPLVHPIR